MQRFLPHSVHAKSKMHAHKQANCSGAIVAFLPFRTFSAFNLVGSFIWVAVVYRDGLGGKRRRPSLGFLSFVWFVR